MADGQREVNRARDGDCYQKARARGQMTFTLVEQDLTAGISPAYASLPANLRLAGAR